VQIFLSPESLDPEGGECFLEGGGGGFVGKIICFKAQIPKRYLIDEKFIHQKEKKFFEGGGVTGTC